MAEPKTPPLGVGAPKTPQVSGAPAPPKHEAPKATKSDPASPGPGTPAPLGAGPPAALVVPIKPVEEAQVKAMLKSIGRVLGIFLSDPDVEGHWRFTDDELDGIVPPFTSVVNRRPALAAAVHRGDEIFVAIQLAGYLGRNIDDGKVARRNRRDLANEFDRADITDQRAEVGEPQGRRGSTSRGGLFTGGSPDVDPGDGSLRGPADRDSVQ